MMHPDDNKKILAGLVTIDVEPDNVWSDTHSSSYENIKCLPAFHDICNDYGVRPTYLITWSVASDSSSSKIIEKLLLKGGCEIGIHPHLWETPPLIDKDKSQTAWVGPNYEELLLGDKLFNLTHLIKRRFGKPTSHRAGRWGLDPRQVGILVENEIMVDSSIVPGIDWSSTGILNHSKAPLDPYVLSQKNIFKPGSSGVVEVPCTIKPGLRIFGLQNNRFVSRLLQNAGYGPQWLRATPKGTYEALEIITTWAMRTRTHVNIMSHSSEFIANGSPYWKTDSDIYNHFSMYHKLFNYWIKLGIKPCTLTEFALDFLS